MEQALIVHLRLGLLGGLFSRAQVHALEDELARAIADGAVGEFDGAEFGFAGQCDLFMYGPDADALFEAVSPVLKRTPVATGGFAIKRHGDATDPNAREVRVAW
jgi:hypothetical protein